MSFAMSITNQVTSGSLSLGSAPYILRNLTIGSPESKTATNNAPYQDGSTYIGSLLKETPLDIEGVISAASFALLGTYRRAMEAVLNPKDGEAVISVVDSGTARSILAVPDPGVIFPRGRGQGPLAQRFIITMLAANPLWYDPSINSVPIVEGTPGDCDNDGDWETPVTIIIDGPCENPVVTNTTTGKAIKVNITLLAGETLTIATAFGGKTITKTSGGTDTNEMNNLDATDRDFFWLERGTNTITIADDAVTDAEMTVNWYNRYLGV